MEYKRYIERATYDISRLNICFVSRVLAKAYADELGIDHPPRKLASHSSPLGLNKLDIW